MIPYFVVPVRRAEMTGDMPSTQMALIDRDRPGEMRFIDLDDLVGIDMPEEPA